MQVPEINGSECKKSMLIANPNCTTAIAAMALYPLHQKYTIKKVIASTYQAASGAGQEVRATDKSMLAKPLVCEGYGRTTN